MALFLLSPLSSSLSTLSSSHSFLSMAIPAANPISRLQRKTLSVHPRPSGGVWIHNPLLVPDRRLVIARAVDDVDGKDLESPDTQKEKSEKPVSVENLPLESKAQMMLEQKQKMKIAKKIRLKRKRLLRKRRMRKKGRWPPSKMRKLKNV
ncbi:hypothetical protein MRB53_009564 [Persea americana]|uniref:Uncharacterized protein n=1 Tax=Persea americana TaxID=3435 RepID=A0ACC2LQE3_PERAE|nr:hypothetical protein MRB53_009564 [Persea americana]|eukprot:TRINITY_DN103729_c0_g1_i1.p1 TRINITY_DN103729_c0_g1~~TRINITY_DN103729_c0_g1_i1.p1  ORF type:complete len:150 (-),score=44.30 TRINITY_DN103729_c0_g1_i1:74-523(-)